MIECGQWGCVGPVAAGGDGRDRADVCVIFRGAVEEIRRWSVQRHHWTVFQPENKKGRPAMNRGPPVEWSVLRQSNVPQIDHCLSQSHQSVSNLLSCIAEGSINR